MEVGEKVSRNVYPRLHFIVLLCDFKYQTVVTVNIILRLYLNKEITYLVDIIN